MRLIYVRVMRPSVWMLSAVVGLMAAAGCSGSEPTGGTAPVVVTSTTSVPEPTVAPPTTEAVEVDPPMSVEMSVEVDTAQVVAELAATIDPADQGQVDPFGEFGSCSGWRRTIGTYSVLVSQPGEQVTAVSVLTSAPVTGPRTYDADVRVELPNAAPVLATGTVTIGSDLRSGEFLAFEPGGGRIAGSFMCAGGDPDPAVLTAADRAGALDSVEVVALLRRGSSERVVELVVDPERSPEAAVECPAAVGGGGPLLIRVDGDHSVGAITMFELVAGGTSTIDLWVGGTDLAFDNVAVAVADPAVAGTFSATNGDVEVDGAFRCT